MMRQTDVQPLQRKYGEQLTIRKPDLNASFNSSDEDNPFDIRFDLMPELPSHVPTPETIDEGLEGFQRQLQTIFTADEGITTPTRKRTGLSQIPKTPHHSPHSPGAAKIVNASPNGSKWGPEIWKSKMGPSFSHSSHVTKRPVSPSDPVSELRSARKQLDSSPTSSKLILSEEIVETVKRNNSPASQKTRSELPQLQRRWMEENALNLHVSCNNLCLDENPSSRRRFFRPRTQTRSFPHAA
mmetsp:Transcript_20347/g.41899  ORF Transcript_20347/g.41899 Transcript_20347/m.41899 type:complete len:241 (+) Transcript_20347:112-834(+)